MGIWAVPHTKAKAEKLKTLMDEDLPQEESETKLYHIFGSDRLFDNLKEYSPDEDVRFSVAHGLKEIMDMPHDSFAVKWEPEARKICQQILSDFGIPS